MGEDPGGRSEASNTLSIHVLKVWWVGGGGKPPTSCPYMCWRFGGLGEEGSLQNSFPTLVLKVWWVEGGGKPPTICPYMVSSFGGLWEVGSLQCSVPTRVGGLVGRCG